MRTNFFAATTLIAAILGTTSTAAGITYTATILNPPLGFTDSIGHAAAGVTQVGSGYGTQPHDNTHALLWNGTAASVVDLNPSGFVGSEAFGVSDSIQVGYAYDNSSGRLDAMLWRGSAASAIDLHPPGFASSVAFGISGTSIVGSGTLSNGISHALLWNTTAAGAIDLNPAGFFMSNAYAVSDARQVGFGQSPNDGINYHALLWSGSAESVVDLNPAGVDRSAAVGIDGGSQVGIVESKSTFPFSEHAALWHGTPASMVDLNPNGFDTSIAWAVSGDTQVGAAAGQSTLGNAHAMAWSSTSTSAVDLHDFLPIASPPFYRSEAFGISASGEIVGTATFLDDSTSRPVDYAVIWTPTAIPEPTLFPLLISGLVIITPQHRRKSRLRRSDVAQN